jgi:DNA-binding CsgD family transcriptional regulator
MREINGLRESLIKNPAPTRDERPLSVREIDILGLIGQGLANKEIAARAFISIQTVQTHRKHIAAKLGVSGAELVRNAVIRAQTLKLAGTSDRSVGLHV